MRSGGAGRLVTLVVGVAATRPVACAGS
jgi:hypothetical protein